MLALDARNHMAHTYDRSKFDLVVVELAELYFPVLEAFC
ncbi:nucleotidyltransferase substrate binding protein [Niveispirillum irakense]|nr:nucleotidyltransferase substrate binding protein [Niveispirillum irakense]